MCGFGRLLTQRGEDYLVCLQSILPSRLDPLAARLLSQRLFSWTAPLLLPVALVYFVFRYLDQLLATHRAAADIDRLLGTESGL